MNQRTIFILFGITVGGLAWLPSSAISQQESLQDKLVGTWRLVSSTSIRPDGTRTDQNGPDAKGIVIYASDGQFVLLNTRADLPKLASNDRAGATAGEAQAVVKGSLAYYGTYSIDEADKTITAKIEGSTFANLTGGEQKRIITSLTADELKFINPTTPSGVILEVVWKRAK
jgi:hypothetical protein